MCRLRRLAGIKIADMQNNECLYSADMQKRQAAQCAVIISSRRKWGSSDAKMEFIHAAQVPVADKVVLKGIEPNY